MKGKRIDRLDEKGKVRWTKVEVSEERMVIKCGIVKGREEKVGEERTGGRSKTK